MTTQIGTLDITLALERPDLLAAPVATALTTLAGEIPAETVNVAEIDPALADTAAFCARYGVSPGQSANCVVVAGRRDGQARYAGCVILATTRADVNNVARRELDVRKASFVPVATATELTGMEYGGITPLGLPAGWPIFVDTAVTEVPVVIIGSGIRRSKLALPGAALARLPGAKVLGGLGRPVEPGVAHL